MLTSTQAREKWCPMVRIARSELVTTTVGYGPLGDVTQTREVIVAGCNTDALGRTRVPQSCRCIADDCAMWRWGEGNQAVMVNGSPVLMPHGFCGPAGRPEVMP